MGAKANPVGLRLKINTGWKSLWFEDKDYAKQVIADIKLRRKLMLELKGAFISDILIGRDQNLITVTIHSARPGVIIGRGGSGSEKIKNIVEKTLGMKSKINIIEVKKPDTDAAFIAQSIALQLEKRIPFRRAIKQAIEKARDAGVMGIKIRLAGRLNGVDIARREKASFGTIPLSTLKSDVDYVNVHALTTFGIIGVKVWIYKGKKERMSEEEPKKDNNGSK